MIIMRVMESIDEQLVTAQSHMADGRPGMLATTLGQGINSKLGQSEYHKREKDILGQGPRWPHQTLVVYWTNYQINQKIGPLYPILQIILYLVRQIVKTVQAVWQPSDVQRKEAIGNSLLFSTTCVTCCCYSTLAGRLSRL